MWVPHLCERIHSIGAKKKSNNLWIVRKVLLMAKVKMFPLRARHYCATKISASNNMKQIEHSIKLKSESI
jgi:hypothetical protein